MAETRRIAPHVEGMATAYEALLATIGSEDFGPAVRDAVARMGGGVRRIYLYEARGRSENHLHYHDCEPAIETQFSN